MVKRRRRFISGFFVFFLVCISLAACEKNKKRHPIVLEDKKVFVLSRTADPRSLDPQAQFDEASGNILQNTYDTLVEYHYLKRPYELAPLLLSSMPESSEDGLIYSFNLKKSVFFHDDPCFAGGRGRELLADDVLYTLKRFADININTQSWFLLEGVIAGLDVYREKSQTHKLNHFLENVEGLIKTGTHSFQIKLAQKDSLFLYAFAASPLSIVPHEAIEKYGNDFDTHPVGTGPFFLKQYEKKRTMTLVKNPKYHQTYPGEGEKGDQEKGLLAMAHKSLPFLDEVQILFIPEAQPTMLSFKQGNLFWVGLDRDNFTQMAYRSQDGSFRLKDEEEHKFDFYSEKGMSISYMSFNLKDPLMQNKSLRKAIAHAIDINKQIEILANGRGVKLHTPVPPSIAGSEGDIGNFGHEYDLFKAKEFLKKAGFPEGKGLAPISLAMSGSSNSHKDYFEFVRNSLAQIGIILTPQYHTWSAFLKATERGDFQMASAAWAADYPDLRNFYQLFYGKNAPPGQNSGNFQNKEFDKLYEETRFMSNSPERFEKVKKMAQILQEEVPVVLGSTGIITGLLQKWVRCFKRNMLAGYPLKFFDIDKKAQQEGLSLLEK